MNYFENELQNIIRPQYPDATYVGRACYVELDIDTVAKIQFTTGLVANQYNALQITILNRKNGIIDQLQIRFLDLLGTKAVNNPNFPNGIDPHIWDDQGKAQWYVYHPTAADYQKIGDAVHSYLDVFEDLSPNHFRRVRCNHL